MRTRNKSQKLSNKDIRREKIKDLEPFVVVEIRDKMAGKSRKEKQLTVSLSAKRFFAGGESKIGITKKNKSKSKKKLNIEKSSRRKNRKLQKS